MMGQQFSEKIKVSVILPVRNPDPGINYCISSLRNQKLRKIEIIFVDELGTDGSVDKVQAADQSDCRIRILKNKENKGQGYSRTGQLRR